MCCVLRAERSKGEGGGGGGGGSKVRRRRCRRRCRLERVVGVGCWCRVEVASVPTRVWRGCMWLLLSLWLWLILWLKNEQRVVTGASLFAGCEAQ